MKLVLLLCALLAAAVAESIRETETMDPNGMFVDDLIESSGSLPDDEDLNGPDYYGEMDIDSDSDDEEDDDDDDDGSGSGDSDEMDDLESTVDTPTPELSNDIQEEDDHKIKEKEVLQEENDILLKKLIPDEAEPSNEISMASTANDFFSKTEVIVALVAGAVVGLLFAVFIITLLVVRYRRNKGDVNYDTVKKPIYKKAPTVEA